MADGWLRGWKMIAAYMACSRKTAKRYYKRYGMPVRKAPGNMPVALREEIDEWLIVANRKRDHAKE